MNRVEILEFSNAYCFQLVLDGRNYPFSFRVFEKDEAYDKARFLGAKTGLPVFDEIGFPLESKNDTRS